MDVNYAYNHSLIKVLLPHRLPFLMVDIITSYKSGKNPSLLANYAIKDMESLYFPNKPDDHWPSVYLIEGLGQCCNLMIVISALEKRLVEAGLKFDSVFEVLNRLMNDKPDEITSMLKNALNQRLTETYSSIGFAGSAEMEVTGYARKGQIVSYETQLNQVFGSLYYSTVRAYTNNNLIARGTMVSASRKN
jgi:3-hydroxymyristoyl/3-hydroxydecanoyl-(acyl carrier protein) dehydratase